uniref:BTR2 n=1 Tax=Triticum monococcum subsp. aegilopoides TaxID=52163 RepID=A0A2I8BIE3_TRIMO|nr:BTR2 [Triticum monococcum subsp. aegilopoides]AUT19262.1 BTR2 [Triticum monococcum subsp. aegilopoides]AUT19263.1 BTR2 [Triticum monococcum subsp. aegilopoides]AUT19264.1 BTR2 [Triticum monococcum subsp. aegilopoides]AUT19265.1 BTR2 [Triticum monococcum subsp. aegilopoides]
MEQWRSTAADASSRSFTNINGTNAIVDAITGARQQYRLAAEDCRMFRPGVHPLPNAGQGASAGGDIIDLALGRIKRFSRFHAVLGNVFSLCADHIGLQGNAPLWRDRWQLHHADAARHAETALHCLHSAKSHGHAALGVFHVMLRPPSPRAVAHAWAPAAEQLLRGAMDDLAMAEAAVERMRPAMVAQFFDASMLLHG